MAETTSAETPLSQGFKGVFQRLAGLAEGDPELAAVQPDPAVEAAAARPGLSFAEQVDVLMRGYGDRQAVGYRTPSREPEMTALSYRELWSRAGALAAHWSDRHQLGAQDFLVTLGVTGVDYLTVELAGIWLGMVSVPMQSIATGDTVRTVLADSRPRVLATSAANLDKAVEGALTSETIAQIVVFDYHEDLPEHRTAVTRAKQRLDNIAVATLDTAVAAGSSCPVPALAASQDDDLSFVIYTSGSTGTPKGALQRISNQRIIWNLDPNLRMATGAGMVTVNFYPMSHMVGRVSVFLTLACGGTAYFTGFENDTAFFADLASIRPTEIFFVPRICEMLWQIYLSESGTPPEGEEFDTPTLERMRVELLGGRVVSAMVGSALTTPLLEKFMKALLGFEMLNGYGSTEAGSGLLINGYVMHHKIDAYRLVDVPELGYYTTDRPYPRGELQIKSRTVISGYLGRPELNDEIFTADGFYRTGDIFAKIETDRLSYLDRRNNVVKLAQGEFLPLSTLEASYLTSERVHQIVLYAYPGRSYPLAVVVPTTAARQQIPDSRELAESIVADLVRHAKEQKLQPYEAPRAVLLADEPFTQANGMVSDAHKVLRPRVIELYRDRLENKYRELEDTGAELMRALRGSGAAIPPEQGVRMAVAAMLDSEVETVSGSMRFSDLGGDSISAVTLADLLNDMYGVRITVATVTNPAMDIDGIVQSIAAQQNNESAGLSATAVHPAYPRLEASDLVLDTFIDSASLNPDAGQGMWPPRRVLLTGATGYLGRFLVLEWLHRLEQTDGTLYCLVRGQDDAAAQARLDAVFEAGDPDLRAEYRSLRPRLTVIAGDFDTRDLGLSEQDFRSLAESVDLIIHAGALVNHVLPYRELFGPNVFGTAEVIRLALTTRRIPVAFISSVGVIHGSGVPIADYLEDSDLRQIDPVRDSRHGYASGYGDTKWAAEILLREAHDRYGLPVTVFRAGMILGHRKYSGQFNAADSFSRLFWSILRTGLAPQTFYGSTGAGTRPHYDGLPADFVAEAVSELITDSGYATFHAANSHDDGVNLDSFVDWLNAAGHPITRIPDYREWLARFEQSLRALPEPQRQQSILPLLHSLTATAAAEPGTSVSTKHFEQALAERSGATIPHLDQDLIIKYANDFQVKELLFTTE
ncbi:thioester reductase domain-containing protein [Nocardia sp. NPDC020380]|uniref:thioester reductase domain-containing protein n=1 Tax=Nocardia sp. NPDC020380 TaxID=3364309 RepID=UPI0037A030D2